MKKNIFTLLVISSSLTLASCSSKGGNESATTQKEAASKEVKTVKAKKTTQKGELKLTGKVDYNPNSVIKYVPLVSGVVTKTYFSPGDKVKKGQTLLDIRSSELSELQAELQVQQDEVEIASRELKSAQSMYDDNMLSERDLIEAKAKLRQAKNALQKAKDDIKIIGESRGNGIFSVKAPMDGYITESNVSSGTNVTAESDPIFTIADLSKVWVIGNVYANNLKFVKEGMPVHVSILSHGNELFDGKINQLSQVFDSEEKVLKARIEMDNKDLKFKPEMSATIYLDEEMPIEMLSVPSNALVFDMNKYYLVVNNNGTFESKEVVPSGHYNDETYISSGINEGDEIVVENQLLIHSGLKNDK